MDTVAHSPKIGHRSVAIAMMSVAWNLPAHAMEAEAGSDAGIYPRSASKGITSPWESPDPSKGALLPETREDGRETRLPAAGVRISHADLHERGSESFFADSPAELLRNQDAAPRHPEQWGVTTHYRSRSLRTRFGLHWMRFYESDTDPAQDKFGGYALVYPEAVQLLGASFLTSLDKGSLGGEMYVRHTPPLAVSSPAVSSRAADDKRNLPLYVLGNTVHARLSAVYALQSTALWDRATMSVEIGRLRRSGISQNADALDSGRKRQARAVQMVFAPSWSEALPNLDVSLPISLSYSPKGQAPLPGVNGSYKGGRFSIAASAVYQRAWNVDLRYTHFFHEPASQLQKDRNFVSFFLQRSF